MQLVNFRARPPVCIEAVVLDKSVYLVDGKSDGIAVFLAKPASSKLIQRGSTSFKINRSLTIEWE